MSLLPARGWLPLIHVALLLLVPPKMLYASVQDYVLFAPGMEIAGAAADVARYLAAESAGTARLHIQQGDCPTMPPPGLTGVICVTQISTPPAKHPSGSAVLDSNGVWQIAVASEGYLAHEIGHVLGLSDLYAAGGQLGSHEHLMGYVGDTPLPLSLTHLRQLGFATPLFGRAATGNATLFPGDQLPFCRGYTCLYVGLHWKPLPGGSVTPFLEAEWDRPNEFPVRLQYRTLGSEAGRGLWTPPQHVPGPSMIRWEYVPLPLPHVQVEFEPYISAAPVQKENSHWGMVPGLLMLIVVGLMMRSTIRRRNESLRRDQSATHARPDTG